MFFSFFSVRGQGKGGGVRGSGRGGSASIENRERRQGGRKSWNLKQKKLHHCLGVQSDGEFIFFIHDDSEVLRMAQAQPKALLPSV